MTDDTEDSSGPLLCPLSGITLQHPCPVRRCPANLSSLSPTRSCAYNLPDCTPEYIAEATGLDEVEVYEATERQVENLGRIMRDLRYLRDLLPPDTTCERCGYPSGCSTQALCRDRQDAIRRVAVNVVGGSVPFLQAFQLWTAVMTGKADFLTERQRELLRDLLTARDSQHEP